MSPPESNLATGSTDLRDQFDWRNNAQDQAAVRNHLVRSLPPKVNDKKVGHDVSGLGCLTVVLRRLYAAMIPGLCDSVVQLRAEAEPSNPLLRFAWSNFDDGGGPKPSQDVMARRVAAQKTVMDEIESLGIDTSFEGLVQSHIMNDTFWSHPELLLYRKVVEEANEWRERDWNPSLLTKAGRMLFLADVPLQQFIDRSFGEQSTPSGIEIWDTRQPTFMRILMESSSAQSFHDLCTFTVPVGEWTQLEDGTQYDPVASRARYNLTAVVRVRDDPSERDYVRTYELNGMEIRPLHSSSQYTSTHWSVSEAGTYWLFYQDALEPPLPEFSERLGPQDVQGEVGFGQSGDGQDSREPDNTRIGLSMLGEQDEFRFTTCRYKTGRQGGQETGARVAYLLHHPDSKFIGDEVSYDGLHDLE
ncbi:hypothetical protein HJFPF1_07640 [Paramyrothecium foliicola]|nr:hypothetical protein HJFPF1_07640 [Paramyrothecium foliicola]